VKVELDSPILAYSRLLHEQFFERTKDDLTRWWLQLIEARVDSFLQALGYNFEAVPFHYIDQPPRSMPAILKNLELIRLLLKSSGNNTTSATLPTRQSLQNELVEPLKKEIYHRIDEYVRCVMLFLWWECTWLLGIDIKTCAAHRNHSDDQHGEEGNVVDIGQLEELLKKSRTVPEWRRKLLLSLLGDLHYIYEMKRLEQDFFKASAASPQAKAAPSDIVPVTGLIMSKLHRLENELRTVVEHWSRRGFAT